MEYLMKSRVTIIDGEIREIYLDDSFNEEINEIPITTKILHLGKRFNHPIDFLAKYQLEELYLSNDFDRIITYLPVTLKTLHIPCEFDDNEQLEEPHTSCDLYPFVNVPLLHSSL